MNARDFLELADDLSVGTREADWRTAVSRAYYATFHVARELLEQFGFSVPHGEQAHGYLWLRLCNSGHSDVDNAGRDLSDLRQLRNWSDYDIDQPVSQTLASGAVRNADAIITLLDVIPTLPGVRTQIVDTIKRYERNVLRQVTWHP